MPAYAYRATDLTGRRCRGVEQAATAAELARALERRGLLLISHEPEVPSVRLRWSKGRRDVLDLTRAIASLLAAGLPLARTLEICEGIVPRGIAAALNLVRSRVDQGERLHVALLDHSELFPPLYVGVVRAGEQSGDLPGAFARLESQLEKEQALREKLISASIYPLILATVGGIAMLLLVLLVLPRFTEILSDAGVGIPASTSLLLAVSTFAVDTWPLIVIGGIAGVCLSASWVRTERGRLAWSKLLLVTPGIRQLRQAALAARFARLLSVLVSGGAPVLDALRDTADSLADPAAADEVTRLRLRVREGATLHHSLADSVLFPPQLGELIAVGEEAGCLEAMLSKSAEIFERRVEHAAERMASLAEPVMILAFGTLIGFVALSLLQAVYSINANG